MISDEPEWRTRKQRIDPRLDARGWSRKAASSIIRAYRTEEEKETTNGPADYALWLDGHVTGLVDAKKLTVGPQNVLTQAARYSQGVRGGRSLPPAGEQAQICRRTNERLSIADAVEEKVIAATERIDRVAATALAKAFRGELVPTEAELARTEGSETAEQLLARSQPLATSTATDGDRRSTTRRSRSVKQMRSRRRA